MRWIKYAFAGLASLIGLCILALAFVLLTFGEEDYRRLAARVVEHFTGYPVSCDGPFRLAISSMPSLSAESIRFDTKNGRLPPVRSIGKFSVRIDLSKLILGTLVVKELQAEDAVMAVLINEPAESDRDPNDGPISSEDIDLPVFESVRLRYIRLDVIDAAADRTIDIRLRRFALDDVGDAGPMFVSGVGTIAGQAFDIDGRMGALAAMSRGEKPYPVDYRINIAGVSLSVAGSFADFPEAEGMNLRISGEAAELADLFELLRIEAPPLGRLKFDASFVDDLTAPRMPYFSISLSGKPQIQFTANGTVANVLTGEGANIDFAGSCAIPHLLRMIKPESLTGLNLLRLSGSLQESGGVLAIEKLKMEAVSDKGAAVSAAGRIDLGEDVTALGLKNLDLELKAFYPTSEVLKPLLFDRLPEVGPVIAGGRLTGRPESVLLENFTIEGGKGPLRILSKGRITGKIEGKRLIATDINLSNTIKSRTTAILAQAYGAHLPELGAVSADYRLRGSLDRFRIEELILTTETAQDFKTAFIGSIIFDREKDKGLIGKLNIRAQVTAPDVQAAADPFGIGNFPDLKQLQANALISGTTMAPILKNIDLSAGDPETIQIRFTGDLGKIPVSKRRVFAGVDMTATIVAGSTETVSSRLGLRLPELGSLQLKARIKDHKGDVNVETFELSNGTEEKSPFNVSGQILHVNDPRQMRLAAAIETHSGPWVETFLSQPDGVTTPLSGELRAHGTDKGIRIEAFRFATKAGEPAKIEATGTIEDLPNSPWIDLRVNAGILDFPAFGSIIGVAMPELAPVAISGRIGGRIPDMVFDGQIHVGATVFSTNIGTAVTEGRPHINGKIAANIVDLNEIGLFSGLPPEKVLAAPEPKSGGEKPIFLNTPLLPFEVMRAFDLRFNLDADKLIGRNIIIEKLNVDVELDKGRLRIHPASLAYSAGFTEMDFSVDASGAVPVYTLKLAGEDIDVDDLLAYAHKPVILSGSLNLVTDLRSSGSSASDIAANLNGVFSMALENGQVWRMVNLMTKDVSDMLLTAADSRTYTDMRCLIGKIDFEEGVGTIDILYMDAPKIRAKGAGQINLADETLDVVINPQRKASLFKRRSAVRIKGPLANPSAFSLPLAEAAELYGTIVLPFVFLPARALGYLFSLLTNDAETTPCLIEAKK
jgi:uncharacterized protein involved in outer membrane biogenesis